MPLVFPVASMFKVESGLVGQLGKLRAGCVPALGRIANPPQDAILPYREMQFRKTSGIGLQTVPFLCDRLQSVSLRLLPLNARPVHRGAKLTETVADLRRFRR